MYAILHIPKTAGTSLRSFILENFNEDECFFLYGPDSEFTTMQDFQKLNLEEKRKFKIIMGHFPYAHKAFMGLDLVYVTFMRHPVERILSYYTHVMNQRKLKNQQPVSLLKYLTESDDQQLFNLQTRLISGINKPEITKETLHIAKENLNKNFGFASLTELYGQSIHELKNLIKCNKATIHNDNVSTERQPIDYYSQNEINKIINLNELDMELYDFLKERVYNSHQLVNTELI